MERGEYFDVVCPGYHLTFYLRGATLVNTAFCHSLSRTLILNEHFKQFATELLTNKFMTRFIIQLLSTIPWIFRLIFTRTKDIHYWCPSLYFLESEERLKWNVSNIFWTYYVSPGKISGFMLFKFTTYIFTMWEEIKRSIFGGTKAVEKFYIFKELTNLFK